MQAKLYHKKANGGQVDDRKIIALVAGGKGFRNLLLALLVKLAHTLNFCLAASRILTQLLQNLLMQSCSFLKKQFCVAYGKSNKRRKELSLANSERQGSYG